MDMKLFHNYVAYALKLRGYSIPSASKKLWNRSGVLNFYLSKRNKDKALTLQLINTLAKKLRLDKSAMRNSLNGNDKYIKQIRATYNKQATKSISAQKNLSKYIHYALKMHHSNFVKISKAMGQRPRFLSSVLAKGGSKRTLDHIINVLPKYAPVSYKIMRKIINGDTKEFLKVRHHYLMYRGQYYHYNAIYYLRLQQHVSLHELAERLNVSYLDVKAILQKAKRPSVKTVIKVSHALQLPITTLSGYFGYSFDDIQRGVHDKRDPLNILLRQIRRQKGFSQNYVAKKLHIKQTEVSALERGREPNISLLSEIADLYHIDFMSLVHMTKNFKHLQKNSPTYLILMLCYRNHLSVAQFRKQVGINSKVAPIYKEIFNLQNVNDKIDKSVAKLITHAFNMPTAYFWGKTSDKIFNARWHNYRRLCKQQQEKYGKKITKNWLGYKVEYYRLKLGITYRQLADHMVNGFGKKTSPQAVQALTYRHHAPKNDQDLYNRIFDAFKAIRPSKHDQRQYVNIYPINLREQHRQVINKNRA